MVIKTSLICLLNWLWLQKYTKSSPKDQNFDIFRVLYQNKPYELMGKNSHCINAACCRSTTVVTLLYILNIGIYYLTTTLSKIWIPYDIPLFAIKSQENWKKMGYHIGIQISDTVVSIYSNISSICFNTWYTYIFWLSYLLVYVDA